MSGTNEQMSYVEIDGKDLPAYCPNPSMPIWSTHPKVYLDLGNEGVGKCPYCGTVYRVKPGTAVHGH
jgi:uncharacterized Zn-finger protein